MQGPLKSTPVEQASQTPGRLHYLDWLQVIAILGVILFHTVHAFDDLTDWCIKNEEKSAFYVVQWEMNLQLKMLIVVSGSFAVSLGLYELLKRIALVRVLLGMKA